MLVFLGLFISSSFLFPVFFFFLSISIFLFLFWQCLYVSIHIFHFAGYLNAFGIVIYFFFFFAKSLLNFSVSAVSTFTMLLIICRFYFIILLSWVLLLIFLWFSSLRINTIISFDSVSISFDLEYQRYFLYHFIYIHHI